MSRSTSVNQERTQTEEVFKWDRFANLFTVRFTVSGSSEIIQTGETSDKKWATERCRRERLFFRCRRIRLSVITSAFRRVGWCPHSKHPSEEAVWCWVRFLPIFPVRFSVSRSSGIIRAREGSRKKADGKPTIYGELFGCRRVRLSSIRIAFRRVGWCPQSKHNSWEMLRCRGLFSLANTSFVII